MGNENGRGKEEKEVYEIKEIFAMATDPIYIGTGGYTIGRVDNTIVRDPITKIPKIPGSSLAGTWRYYMTLELISKIKEYQPTFEDIKKADGSTLSEKLKKCNWVTDKSNEGKFLKLGDWIKNFAGNKMARITCAGQDNTPTADIDSPDKKNENGKTGHCGHCIVCKAFGYSKKDKSWQGMLLFSDLNILFFPVYTRLGVKWISSERILKEAGLLNTSKNSNKDKEKEVVVVFAQEKIENDKNQGYINLGWLNLPYEIKNYNIEFNNFELKSEDIIIVPDSLISQIINSNLEVRTSVSIDPITGAAKETALFTSEAIPRGTIFYGEIRLFNRNFSSKELLPASEDVWEALNDTKKYYETLGIGGMTTRGFGRMKLTDLKHPASSNNNGNSKSSGGGENGTKQKP